MAWKGFLAESRSYMGYPTAKEEFAEQDHSDLVGGKTAKERKAVFWKAFPRAWTRFHFLIFKDWLRL